MVTIPMVVGGFLKYTPYADDKLPEGKILVPFNVVVDFTLNGENPQTIVVPNVGMVHGVESELALGSNGQSNSQLSTIKALQFSYRPSAPNNPVSYGRLIIITPFQETFIFQPACLGGIVEDPPSNPNNPSIINACIEVCASLNPVFRFIFEADTLDQCKGQLVGMAYNFTRRPYVAYMDNQSLDPSAGS